MPSTRRARRSLSLTALVLAAYSCGDGSAPTFREKKCDEICARYEMCDDVTDVPGCQQSCGADEFRSDRFFEIKATCITDLSCNRLSEQDGSVPLNDCIGDALPREKLGDRALTLCQALANKVADCWVAADPVGVRTQCERVAITLSEPYLKGSEECATQRCADLGACYADLADSYDTSVAIYTE